MKRETIGEAIVETLYYVLLFIGSFSIVEGINPFDFNPLEVTHGAFVLGGITLILCAVLLKIFQKEGSK
ncbi:MAG: hypothetical protein Q8P15_02660 [Nanoarchaeota archaeon]|nr:hypothetical protein [Nanoarchaeota archaeon]